MKAKPVLLLLAALAACGFSGGDPAAKQRERCERWDFMKNFRAGQTALYRFGGQLYEIPAPYFGGGPTLAPKDLTEDSDVASLHMFWPAPDDALMLPPHTQRDFACYGRYKHNIRLSVYPNTKTVGEQQYHLKSLATSGAILSSDVHGPCGGRRYQLDRGSVYKDPKKRADQAAEARESIAQRLHEICLYTGDVNWISRDEWRALWRDAGRKYGLRALTPYGPDEPGGLDDFSFGYLEQDTSGKIRTAMQCRHRGAISYRQAIAVQPYAPRCVMHFYHSGVSVSVRFEAEHLPDWQRIKAGIIRTLDCFRANALREEPAATCTYDRDYYAAQEERRLETLRAQDRQDLERMRGDDR